MRQLREGVPHEERVVPPRRELPRCRQPQHTAFGIDAAAAAAVSGGHFAHCICDGGGSGAAADPGTARKLAASGICVGCSLGGVAAAADFARATAGKHAIFTTAVASATQGGRVALSVGRSIMTHVLHYLPRT